MRMLDRIKKAERTVGDPRARHVVYAAPTADTPAAIDAAIRKAAVGIGVPIESVDMACLFLPNDYREIKYHPHAEFAHLSDKGAMGRILGDLDGRDTGLATLK